MLGNCGIEGNHIIKVICGNQNEGKSDKKTGLKEAFEEYLIEKKYDFVYFPQHGKFLLRLQFALIV